MRLRQSFSLSAVALFALALLAGCAVSRIEREARSLASEGEFERAIETIDRGVARYQDEARLRAARVWVREAASMRLLSGAMTDLAAGRDEPAQQKLQRLLQIDPANDRARGLQLDVERERRQRTSEEEVKRLIADKRFARAQAVAEEALKDNPRHAGLLRLRRDIELELRATAESRVLLADTQPISFEFRDASVRMVLEALSRTTSVNFIVDREIRADQRVTIFLKRASLEDALNFLASSNQLAIRVLNDTTVLVYPNTPERAREYQDLLIRAFYLVNADAKQTGNLLRSMLKLRDVFVDDKLNLLVVRDTPEAIRLAERLVALHDLGEPEVMLEVEVLEINSARLTELGIKYPDSFSLSPLSAGDSSSLTLQDLRNLNSSRIGIGLPNVLVNLRREVGDLNILANPRIRARNREKARILIGDRVPVITTTAGNTGFISENVQYVDVGLKLEVEPNVYFDDDVAIKVGLEVSSLVREIRTTSGSLAYQIGTRNANTTLRLRDGETQLLAGLISNEDRVNASRIPGLGDLPLAGRLFSSQKDDKRKTEIVLSITPRLLRSARIPDANFNEFWSGTETRLRGTPLTLAAAQERPGAWNTEAQAAAGRRVGDAPSQVAGEPGVLQPGRAAAADRVQQPVAALSDRPPPNAASAITRRVARRAETLLTGPGSVKQGSTFEVAVRLRADGGIRSLPLQIGYDPTKLQVVDVKEGEYFRRDGGSTSFARQVLPQDGRVLVSVQRMGTEGTQGEETVVTLELRAIATGSSRVSVTSAAAAGVEGSTPNTVLAVPLEVVVTN